MTTETTVKPPTWFWIVSVLALLWNLIGVSQYLMLAYIGIEELEQMTEAQRLLYESQPAWVTGAFAMAVWGGALGCILLLLKKKLAVGVLLISLIGILAQVSYNLFISTSFEVYGVQAVIMPTVILIIGIALFLFARKASANHWLA